MWVTMVGFVALVPLPLLGVLQLLPAPLALAGGLVLLAYATAIYLLWLLARATLFVAATAASPAVAAADASPARW